PGAALAGSRERCSRSARGWCPAGAGAAPVPPAPLSRTPGATLAGPRERCSRSARGWCPAGAGTAPPPPAPLSRTPGAGRGTSSQLPRRSSPAAAIPGRGYARAGPCSRSPRRPACGRRPPKRFSAAERAPPPRSRGAAPGPDDLLYRFSAARSFDLRAPTESAAPASWTLKRRRWRTRQPEREKHFRVPREAHRTDPARQRANALTIAAAVKAYIATRTRTAATGASNDTHRILKSNWKGNYFGEQCGMISDAKQEDGREGSVLRGNAGKRGRSAAAAGPATSPRQRRDGVGTAISQLRRRRVLAASSVSAATTPITLTAPATYALSKAVVKSTAPTVRT
ncbi:MAG: hypothetical protein BJ554DRAFT_4784, partial [Olpidium bornovanus]